MYSVASYEIAQQIHDKLSIGSEVFLKRPTSGTGSVSFRLVPFYVLITRGQMKSNFRQNTIAVFRFKHSLHKETDPFFDR